MNEYPKKTCEIERLVTIPEDVVRVIKGQKTATRRNGVYAHPGEVMVLDGQEFMIDALYSQELGEMTDADALREGFTSLEAYKESILSIHPYMSWSPTMKVWVHEFSPVKK